MPSPVKPAQPHYRAPVDDFGLLMLKAERRLRAAWNVLRAAGGDTDKLTTVEHAFLTAVAELEGLPPPSVESVDE